MRKVFCKWPYLIILIIIEFLQATVESRTPQDCEIINLRSNNETISLTFEDSLRMSIFLDQKIWNVSVEISDPNSNRYSLELHSILEKIYDDLKILDYRFLYYYQDSCDLENVFNITLVNIHLDVTQCKATEFSCTSRMRVVFDHLLTVDRYKPLWNETLLQPPFTLKLTGKTSADLIFGCRSPVCYQNSSALSSPNTERMRSFFLKPGESVQGFTLLLHRLDDESFKEAHVDTRNIRLFEDSWVQVRLEKDEGFHKITVDDQELLQLKNYSDQENIKIKSVQLRGRGMLTWCDPRSSADPSKDPTKSIIIGVLVVCILTLTGVFTYYWKKSPRETEEKKILISECQPSPTCDREAVPIPKPSSMANGPTKPVPIRTPRIEPKLPNSSVSGEFMDESQASACIYESIDENFYLPMKGKQTYESVDLEPVYANVDGRNTKESSNKDELYIAVY